MLVSHFSAPVSRIGARASVTRVLAIIITGRARSAIGGRIPPVNIVASLLHANRWAILNVHPPVRISVARAHVPVG